MRFYQPIALVALFGLVAAAPVAFDESLAVRNDGLADPAAEPVLAREALPSPAKGKKGKAKKGKKGKAAKAKAKAKAKKGKKRDLADIIEDLFERSAEALAEPEPLDLSSTDTVVVARTPDADPEAEWEDIVQRSPAKGKKGKGKKGKGKAKKGKGKAKAKAKAAN